MSDRTLIEQRSRLNDAMGQLSEASSLEALVAILRANGRVVAGADGFAVIRREGDLVAYLAEDSPRPLWTGRRFAITACISGLAMIEGKPIHIPDVYADQRVPHAAYRPTFVRSMAMYPIGLLKPSMAIGAYWCDPGPIDPVSATLLATLARFAGVTHGRIAPHPDGRLRAA